MGRQFGAKPTSLARVLVVVCVAILGFALIADIFWASSSKFTSSYFNTIVSNQSPHQPSILPNNNNPRKPIGNIPGRVLSATFQDLPGPELKWEKMATAPVPRLDGAAIQIKDLLFVFAGYGTIDYVPLFNILKKYDGETVTDVVHPRVARIRYRVTRLPQYLILHMQRFAKNNFFVEKNPTLVNFPIKNLELKGYIPLPTPEAGNERLRSKYDLIANIIHDGKPDKAFYRVFVQRKSEELWYEIQDLHVSETLPQMVALSEAYMLIYERQQ